MLLHLLDIHTAHYTVRQKNTRLGTQLVTGCSLSKNGEIARFNLSDSAEYSAWWKYLQRIFFCSPGLVTGTKSGVEGTTGG